MDGAPQINWVYKHSLSGYRGRWAPCPGVTAVATSAGQRMFMQAAHVAVVEGSSHAISNIAAIGDGKSVIPRYSPAILLANET